MAIISQETFEKFTKEEKEELRQLYSHMSNESLNLENSLSLREAAACELRALGRVFDEENLQPESKG